MTLAQWFGSLRSFLVGESLRLDDTLPQPQQMEAIIQRERSRADRTGGAFSLLRFRAANRAEGRECLLALANRLRQRSRTIDELGWGRDEELWLVLPHCPPPAASRLAEEMCRAACSAPGAILYLLHHYDASSSGKDTNGAAVTEPAAPSESARPGGSAQPAPIFSPTGAAGQNGQHCSVAPQSLDELLDTGMPLWKRAIDVAAAGTALVLLAPLFAVVALAIKLTSRGPVFFSQWRAGRNGRPFKMYKFRSMVVDAEQLKPQLIALNEQDGPAFKIDRDPRITPIGRVLREFSIDELPQLWNVLKGDMSLVGPRPLPVDEAARCQTWQRQRVDAVPGLTCFWQVKDRSTKVPFADWARMDIRYIRSRSLWTDLRLIFKTLLFVIRRRGV